MDIGIVGAGQIGGVLARRLTELGHRVEIANSRGPETLAALARESGATAVDARQAARGKQVVVVTIPEGRVPDLPGDLFAGAGDDLVVVDTGNYYPRQRDGRIAAIEAGTPESAWVSEQLGRPVVKAFNNIGFRSLDGGGRPPGDPDRIALPVAGDDERAKRIVMDLVDALGFDPIDAGTLADSWRQQPGTPIYVADRDAAGVRAGLADASSERLADFTATDASPGTMEDPR
jgi:8-hydroxy-5-deazaflavin:NADPH oxidoreductase